MSPMDYLERPEAWPPMDDVGEVFLGRAFVEVADCSMELMIVHPHLLEEPAATLLTALQAGRLSARAQGDLIPATAWRAPLGWAMLLSCATSKAELAAGEIQPGPRPRWIAVTRESLDRFKRERSHQEPANDDSKWSRAKETLALAAFKDMVEQSNRPMRRDDARDRMLELFPDMGVNAWRLRIWPTAPDEWRKAGPKGQSDQGFEPPV